MEMAVGGISGRESHGNTAHSPIPMPLPQTYTSPEPRLSLPSPPAHPRIFPPLDKLKLPPESGPRLSLPPPLLSSSPPLTRRSSHH